MVAKRNPKQDIYVPDLPIYPAMKLDEWTPSLDAQAHLKKKHMIFWVSIRQLLGFRTILITWRCKLRSHRNPMAKVLWCYFPGFRRGWTVPSMFQGQTCVICTLGSTNMAGLENGPWMIEDVPSRELTYPSKMAFRRWFSFSQGGIC